MNQKDLSKGEEGLRSRDQLKGQHLFGERKEVLFLKEMLARVKKEFHLEIYSFQRRREERRLEANKFGNKDRSEKQI
jgi:hypothetical protein